MVSTRTKLLTCLYNKLFPQIVDLLRALRSKEELKSTFDKMRSEKALGYNGMMTKFYKKFRNIITNDYTTMVKYSIARRFFLPTIVRGFITLLFKEGNRRNLKNWCPITLLNVNYKIFAKVLQKSLRSVLIEIINIG